MKHLDLVITSNCNLECSHCCVSSGPGKPTMSYDSMQNVVGNIPYDVQSLTVTGGEPFTRRKLLYQTLDTIQQRNLPKLETLEVQTNGFWARNNSTVQSTLDELTSKGVTNIYLTSNDQYHVDAGLDMENVGLLSKALQGRGIWVPPFLSKRELIPVGRARNIPEHFGEFDHDGLDGCANFEDKYALVNFDGQLYPCCWAVEGTELGDVTESPVEEVIKESLQNENFKTLIKPRGPEMLARKSGIPQKEIEELKQYGNCAVCIEAFRRGLKL